jgi:hypothetical protein
MRPSVCREEIRQTRHPPALAHPPARHLQTPRLSRDPRPSRSAASARQIAASNFRLLPGLIHDRQRPTGGSSYSSRFRRRLPRGNSCQETTKDVRDNCKTYSHDFELYYSAKFVDGSGGFSDGYDFSTSLFIASRLQNKATNTKVASALIPRMVGPVPGTRESQTAVRYV